MSKEFIRNFVIISHIDHGKSTLADRFLEITKTVDPRKMQPQYLDRMALERERGITIKMQPVRMSYTLDSNHYILNLIDTPGHVDFSYEVSRGLAAVEGAVLLVDATKGIQAQTVTNLEMAKEENLVIIPVINKIDIAQLDQIEKSQVELAHLLKIDQEEICLVSAKTGEGVEKILDLIIKKIPSSQGDINKPLRALIFDAEYDFYKGVIAHIRIIEGTIKKGDKIYLIGSKTKAEVVEVGYFAPEMRPCNELRAGEIGYVATGLKEIEKSRVGDTITEIENNQNYLKVKPLKGYREPQPRVCASFYPVDKNDFDLLKNALNRLKLNDASLVFEIETNEGLGRGFRCGFLGLLHLEIITERLKRDYNLDLIVTSPSVVYRFKNKDIEEPWVRLEIITLGKFLGPVMELLKTLRGEFKETNYLSQDKIIISYESPLNDIITGFYDKLKSVSSGYASMSYDLIGYRKGKLVRLDILLAGEKINAFSKIVPEERAYKEGKRMVVLLKEIIPAQQFAVPIQAVIGSKVIARETKKALRKDVTAPLYGGDFTRKKKLLEKQKKGKKKLAKFGKVTLSSEVFLEALRKM